MSLVTSEISFPLSAFSSRLNSSTPQRPNVLAVVADVSPASVSLLVTGHMSLITSQSAVRVSVFRFQLFPLVSTPQPLNLFSHPVLLGLREDKDARQVAKET